MLIPGLSNPIPGLFKLIPGSFMLIPDLSKLILGLFKLIPGLFKLIPGLFWLILGLFRLIPGLFNFIPGLFMIIPGFHDRLPFFSDLYRSIDPLVLDIAVLSNLGFAYTRGKDVTRFWTFEVPASSPTPPCTLIYQHIPLILSYTPIYSRIHSTLGSEKMISFGKTYEPIHSG